MLRGSLSWRPRLICSTHTSIRRQDICSHEDNSILAFTFLGLCRLLYHRPVAMCYIYVVLHRR